MLGLANELEGSVDDVVGVEFVTLSDGLTPDPNLRDQVMQKCFENGLLLLGCGESTLRFCPPLIVTREEVDVLAEGIRKVREVFA